ncbi:3-hydroxyacyl-CoA dehydrogenase family protein [Maliponia aquimaris]|uniref:Fatty acid oxidation complex subunit alpha n=1 Tax=Maliponia aquimaris TaxID=1673631 RepID=A0A238L5X6_9RHOB|nr:3-hydroxyacyl-CoA dehydrogenase family protein [Maliponia aquimaris]SMX50211.1 Fatty acid oxidation complex subunit alpha [Maliponia aquimaris]
MADVLSERLRGPFRDAAEAVFYHGSTPWEVDEAMEAFGFARGPFAAEDILGLDLAWERRRDGGPPILRRMMELGKLGRKSGAGWYRYPGGGGKVEDPIVADLALEEAHFHRVARVDYAEAQIRERLLAALIVAARGLLAEGYAAAEIDRAAIAALGFPAERGGPLVFAATMGADWTDRLIERVRDEGRVPLPPRT